MAVHYYPLINKIIASLNLRERLAILKGKPDPEITFTRPFITIAREPGSGGAPIARLVAHKLGFQCIDEEIVEDIAGSTKKRKEVIKAIDEKSRSAIEDMVHSMLNRDYVDDIKYVTELVQVILAYAHQGNMVILGRGANFITPFSRGLHVNITAPYAVRVERAMKYEQVKKGQAESIIAKVEDERKLFVKQYFKQDISKCNSYDLTINTTYFTFDQVADIIIESFYRKFPRSVRYKAIFKK